MKRICVIGDSHVAALKFAWWEIAQEFPDIKITWFTSHRRRFVDLVVRGDRLVPEGDELREVMRRSCKFEPEIAADYDRYVVCGLDYSMYVTMHKLAGFRSEDQAPDNRAPLSSACYLQAMTGILRDTVSLEVARKVRAITAQPMTIVPSPRISDANPLKLYPRFRETGDAERIAGYFFAASDILGREVGAEMARQPAETLRDPLLTLAVYTQDAPREFGDTERPEGWIDYQHMNAEYGALMLRALFAAPGS